MNRSQRPGRKRSRELKDTWPKVDRKASSQQGVWLAEPWEDVKVCVCVCIQSWWRHGGL